ncbi:hypothetical protein EC968_000742 [Mortierella alpina]|nr:hypothetical protein EC968_000742 [Mortierella alpina]
MSTSTAPPRIKAVVSVPARRPKIDPAGAAVIAGTEINSRAAAATAAATPATEATDATATTTTSGRPQRLHCPGCSSTNVVVEDEGETICHDCGLVLADDITLTSGDNDVSGYGLTRVNDVGRSLDHNRNLHKIGHGINMASSEDRRELYSSRSVADAKIYLEQISTSVGLPIADAHRALYLWTAFKNLMGIKYTKYAKRASIACLYVAALEAKREVTLNQLSARTEINTNTLGSVYKDVKQTLLKHKFIHSGGNLELDPWMVLDKILTLDSETSIQSGLMDDLSRDLREALGASLPPKDKAERLQKLLRVSQRCMALAIEADMLTGRLPIPLACACVVVAVQVEGKLAQCPEELIEFVAKVWMAAPSTVKKRYMELKKYILECVSRLPFDVGGNRKTRTLYSLTGVLSYSLFFDKSQGDQWSGADSGDSDGDADEGQDYIDDEDLEENQAENSPAPSAAGSAEPERVQAVESIKPAEAIEEVEEVVGEVEETAIGLKRKLDTLEMNSPHKKHCWHEQQDYYEDVGEADEEGEEDVVEQGYYDHDQDDGYDYDGDDD